MSRKLYLLFPFFRTFTPRSSVRSLPILSTVSNIQIDQLFKQSFIEISCLNRKLSRDENGKKRKH